MAELAWPTDLGHGTFIGRFGFMDADTHDTDRDPDITSATGGAVTITPSIRSVRYAGVSGPMILAARPAKGVIDAEGYLCTKQEDGTPGDRGMVFPATDDTDLSPTDWTYEVSIVLDGSVRLPTFNVNLPEGATVDLSVAVPVPSSGGTAIVVDPTTATRAEAAATRAETAADEAEGYAPTFAWDGTSLIIDGGDPVDLKGETGDVASHVHDSLDRGGNRFFIDSTGGLHQSVGGESTLTFDHTGKMSRGSVPPGSVDGLQDRLAALEYDSGWRDMTSLMAVAPTVGALYVRREGRRVWAQAAGLKFAASASFVTLTGLLPSGFRPARVTDLAMGRRLTNDAGGSFRANGDGTAYFYQVTADQQIDGVGDFLTSDPTPTPGTEPGAPA